MTAPGGGVPEGTPVGAGAMADLALGTAQLGLDYGVTNRHGRPDGAEAMALLATAARHGIATLDTARAYGTSEEAIGRARTRWGAHADGRSFPFAIVTKLDPGVAAPGQGAREAGRDAGASVRRSLDALGVERLDALLLHRPAQRAGADGAAWRTLLELREQGLIDRLGVSLSTPDQLLEALGDPDVAHVQFPSNCLDHRFETRAVRGALACRPDVTVHVRSAFLQGLIVAGTRERLVAMFGGRGHVVADFLERLPALAGRRTRLAAAIAYARSLAGVDAVVVGTGRAEELEEIVTGPDGEGAMPLDADRMAAIREERPMLDDDVLDPARWGR